tara:strand:+ start:88 stop:723 length:636 start_codon:yes stop_codon:yes gene_type:complete
MAISTYLELKNAGQNWLNRSDLTDRIPEFILLAEAQLNRRLRTRQMLVRTTSTVTSQYVSLPTNFLEAQNVELTSTSPPKRLTYLTSDRADDLRNQFSNTTGTPNYFTIQGEAIELLKTPDTSYTLQINYYKKLDSITTQGDSGTTWLLTSHPDILLYGLLMQAEPFLMNDERINIWNSLLEKALVELEFSDDRSKYSGATLIAKPKFIYT